MRIWYRNLDYLTVGLWLLLTAAGFVAIYSVTHGGGLPDAPSAALDNFDRQLFWFAASIVAIGIAMLLPIRFYTSTSYLIYAVAILLLITALLVGHEVNGARSWLRIGPLQFQVSEFAKVATVLAVANLLSSRRSYTRNVRYAVASVGLIIVPAALIVLQNDMGTAVVFFGLIPIMLFWSGLSISVVLVMISPALAGYLAVVSLPFGIGFAVVFTVGLFWMSRDRAVTALALILTGGTVLAVAFALSAVLQPYQVARILSFTNPEAEEYRDNVGFHLVQSKAAIGSGGLIGKGYMEGTQTQGAYVPEQSTDFIFSVIGEEFGFVGANTILILFAVFLMRLLVLGIHIKHSFGVMVAAGAVGIFLIHIFINVGMATGILPVIGIPLPFISYGGSALLANSALVGIVLSLYMRRDDFSIYGY